MSYNGFSSGGTDFLQPSLDITFAIKVVWGRLGMNFETLRIRMSQDRQRTASNPRATSGVSRTAPSGRSAKARGGFSNATRVIPPASCRKLSQNRQFADFS